MTRYRVELPVTGYVILHVEADDPDAAADRAVKNYMELGHEADDSYVEYQGWGERVIVVDEVPQETKP